MVGSSVLDLESAWNRVRGEAVHDSVPDIVHWQDFGHDAGEWMAELHRQIDSGDYEPRVPLITAMPKDGFTTRPLARMDPRDRVIYEAAVDALLPAIEGALSNSVYSARVDLSKTGRNRMRPQKSAWAEFQRAGRELIEAHDTPHLLSTDVSSYFEHVEVSILMTELRALSGTEPFAIQVVSTVLNGINRSSDVWGLPQGPTASSILGNFYLLPVDTLLERSGLRSLRFQDDIKVFANDRTALQGILREIESEIRSRHLNLASAKTTLVAGSEALTQFEDARKDAIQYGIRIRSEDTLEEIRAYFDEIVGKDHIRGRDVRFAVNLLIHSVDPYAIEWVLANLTEVPYLGEYLVRYLSLFVDQMPEIEEHVEKYLAGAGGYTSPFMEMHLVRMLSRASHIKPSSYNTVWRIIEDQNRPIYVREHAARCAGRHASLGDVIRLRAMVSREENPLMRRALIIACTEAAGSPDKGWLKTLELADPEVARVCRWLRSDPDLPDP